MKFSSLLLFDYCLNQLNNWFDSLTLQVDTISHLAFKKAKAKLYEVELNFWIIILICLEIESNGRFW